MNSTPVFANESVALYHADALELLQEIPDSSIDAVVTDPPYGLEFMGKEWDSAVGFDRSLNPSSEYRTASKAQANRSVTGGIRQATGPSFLGGLNPKCLACNRWQRGSNPCACDSPEWTQERLVRLHSFQEWCEAWSVECLRVLRPGGHMLAFGGSRTWHRLAAAIEDAGFEIRDSIAWLYGSGFPKSLNLTDGDGERTGWGTALKPAFEPIVVGRKPLAGTVATNVAKHGTGALNIAASRTATDEVLHSSTVPNDMRGGHYGSGHRPGEPSGDRRYSDSGGTDFAATPGPRGGDPAGRWPTNVTMDDSQAAELDAQTGVLTSGANPTKRGTDKFRNAYGDFKGQEECVPARGADSGGASRFFPTFRYEAKAAADERPNIDGVLHPTVKPLDLMRWLVRLVTPTGGTVLEPFAGSGTTVEACILERFKVIAIERDETYLPLIRQRIDRRLDPIAALKSRGEDGGLFDLIDGGAA